MNSPNTKAEADAALLRQMLHRLDQRYGQKPRIQWSTYAANKPAHAGSVVELRQEDFSRGTLRITEPCMLRLMESVQVNPNRPTMLDERGNPTQVAADERRIDGNRTLDWFPDLSDPQQAAEYGEGDAAFAYQLGFFASIAIEADDVILDLGGHTLEMSQEFALQQRFHALIELADQPFLTGQGPADFGRSIRPARRVWVRNGTLGRSSHHGIHGNDVQDALLSDLVFRDYEVAAISLNGGSRTVIQDCRALGTRRDTPVLGTYSTGRFLRRHARKLLRDVPEPPTLPNIYADLELRLCRVEQALDSVFDQVIFGAASDRAIPALYRNDSGVTDGNNYGIALHSRGVLVGAFQCPGGCMLDGRTNPKNKRANRVQLSNVTISDTRGNIREIVALTEVTPDGTGKPLVDTSGSVFPVLATGSQPGNMGEDGSAQLTQLGSVQVLLAKIKHALPPEAGRYLGRLNLPPSLVKWAETPSQRLVQRCDVPSRWDIVEEWEPAKPLATFEMRCNGDTMHHVNKGVIGLFIQAVDGLQLKDVSVSNTMNIGQPGTTKVGPYVGARDGGHADQGHQLGYCGADTRGAYFGACFNAQLESVYVSRVTSAHGQACAFEVAGASKQVDVQNCRVEAVDAGQDHQSSPGTPSFPNHAPRAVGFRVGQHTSRVSLERCYVEDQPRQPGPEHGHEFEVLSASATIRP